MTNHQFIFLISSFFLIVPLLSGQGFIEGTVYEVVDNKEVAPLPFVNIYFSGTTSGASTDENGFFKVLVPEDAEKIIFSAVSLQNDTVDIATLENPVTIVMNGGNILPGVIVKVKNGKFRYEKFNPRDAHIITEGELRKAACCNLSESFETNPSIDANYTDAVTGTKQIQMLGLSGKYVQTMQDNIPLIRGLSTIYGFEYIPGSWVNSIQVSKGVGSVVNGYESMTGQLNIDMKNPVNGKKLHLNAFVNSAQRYELNINTTQKINKRWKTTLLAHGKYSDKKWDNNGDGFLDNPLHQNVIVQNQWNYAGPKIHMEYGAGYINLNTEAGRFSSVNPYIVNNQTQRGQGFVKIGYLYPDEDYKSIAVQASGTIHQHKGIFGDGEYNGLQKSGYFNLIFQDEIGEGEIHKYKTGASLVYDSYEESVENLGTLTDKYGLEEIVPGAYFEYALNKEVLSLVAGVRADYHNQYGAFITPRLNARYSFTENNALKISAGMGRRTSNVFMENVGLLATSRNWIIYGDEDLPGYGLKQEIAQNYGIGFNQTWKINKRELIWNIDAYHTRFQNQIVMDWDESPQEIHIYNLDGQSYSNSIQTEVSYEVTKRLDVRMAYRFLDVKTQYLSGLLDVPMVAKHRAFTNIAYETRKNKKGSHWKFDATLQYIGQQRVPTTKTNPIAYQKPGISDPFLQLSSQVTYVHGKNLEFYIGGENLTNYTLDNPILSSENPDSQYFDGALVWGPIFGRMVYAGLRWTIQ